MIEGYSHDIFISYRQNDNQSGWVTEFVKALQAELAATIKEPVSIYFDSNPVDGLLESHDVNKSLEGKLKSFIFIPILSQTYCDPKSFAWAHEFCAFNTMAKADSIGRDLRLSNGNVASRILPVKIHDIDPEDKSTIENEIGGALRSIDFIFRSAGVNRPLHAAEEHPHDNLNKTFHRDQVNKVANAVKELINSAKPSQQAQVRTAAVDTPFRPSAMKPYAIAAALAIIALIAYYAITGLNPVATEKAQALKSIAVLPFANLSNDPEQEYFSDGITEQLITNLAHVDSLKVIARTSVMKFKKTEKTVAEIGRELNVTHVLEGSVRKSEGRVRITAQLISVANESHLWAKDYDRKLEDIFTIQDEISTTIVNSLQRKLSTVEYESVRTERSANVEAYQHYLKGYKIHLEEFYVSRRNEDFLRAEKEFQQALERDSTYAPAIASLSDLYDSYRNLSARGDEIGKYEIMRDALARRAYRLSPNNPYVITVYAYVFFNRIGRTDADLDTAWRLREKAYSISPNNVDVCEPLSIIYQIFGLYERAIELRKRTIDLDPTFGTYYSNLGNLYMIVGDLQQAEPYLKKGLLLEPDGIAAWSFWARFNVLRKNLSEAENALKRMREISPAVNTSFPESWLLAAKGEKDKALALSPNLYTMLLLNMAEDAMTQMEKAAPQYLHLKNSPLFDPVRNHPRYPALLERSKRTYEERMEKYGR